MKWVPSKYIFDKDSHKKSDGVMVEFEKNLKKVQEFCFVSAWSEQFLTQKKYQL